MPDVDQSSKTEPPSQKRLQEAFEKGEFARSPEVTTVAVLAAASLYLLTSAEENGQRIAHLFRSTLGGIGDTDVSREAVSQWVAGFTPQVLSAALPFFAVCMGAAVLAAGAQTGFRLTPKALRSDASRISPLSGWKRIYSKNAAVQFLIDLGKMSALGVIIYTVVKKLIRESVFHTAVPLDQLGPFLFSTARSMSIRVVGFMALIAILHYAWQRYDHFKKMHMTRQEVKDEHKQQEGDPMVKSRLRQMGMRLRQRQMLEEVPVADVVVTNPTHFAVALRYIRGKDEAPVVLAKGKNRFAQRIKAVAREHDVPQVENRPVAQALYKLGEVGKPIPYGLFQVIATILSHVYREHRYYFHRLEARRRAAGIAT